MAKRITYSDKNKFGAPPVNIFTDADANEIKDTINDHAKDIEAIEERVEEVESLNLTINQINGTGEVPLTYSSEGYCVKNGNVVTLNIAIEIINLGDYDGTLAIYGIPYKPKKYGFDLLRVFISNAAGFKVVDIDTSCAVFSEDAQGNAYLYIIGFSSNAATSVPVNLLSAGATIIISGSYITEEEEDEQPAE